MGSLREMVKARFVAPEEVGPSDVFPPPQRLEPEVSRFERSHIPTLPQLPQFPDLPELPTELAELTSLRWPPLHVVSADVWHDPAGRPTFYTVRCSCNWEGREVKVEAADSEDEILDRLAAEWRGHVRLSERVFRRSKKFRLEAVATSEQVNRAGVW